MDVFPPKDSRRDTIEIVGEEESEITDNAREIAKKYLEQMEHCQRVKVYTKSELAQEDPYIRMQEMPDIIEFTFWYHSKRPGMKLFVDTLLSTDLLRDADIDMICALLVKDSKRQLEGVQLYVRESDS